MISAKALALVAAALPAAFGQNPDQAAWDAWCQASNGPDSFCKTWQTPSLCRGDDQPCGSGPAPTVTPGTTATPATSAAPGSPSTECDAFCVGLNGPTSYCKYWQPDAVCVGGNQPCGNSQCTGGNPTGPTQAPASEGCNNYCRSLNGALSYCKSWLDAPLCLGGDQSCAATDCNDFTPSGSPGTTQVPPTAPSNIADCDRFCQDANSDATSYCKYWMPSGPVCRGGDQPCSECPSQGSSAVPTSAPTASAAPASPECDAMCIALNDATSYCKNWLSSPLCLGGDQPCGQAACDAFSTATTAAPEATTAAP